jgi:hypothetical protein
MVYQAVPKLKTQHFHEIDHSLNRERQHVELISREVRVMSCVYEVVCQRFCHILMNLQTTNKQIGQFSSYEKQQ